MNKTFVSISSISMDLERVAIGCQRGSLSMANRFLKEALMRRNEIAQGQMKPHLKKLIDGFDKIIMEKDIQKKAEDALMYSTLFQNYTQKYL
jgi:hypothetical protein